MTLADTAQAVPYLNLLVMAAAVFLFWKKGGNDAESKATGAYKNVADAYEKEINQLKTQMTAQAEAFRKQMHEQSESFRAEINALTAKVGELTGILQEKNDRIKTLEEIATNRNPEIITLMTDIRNFMQNINAYLASQAAIKSSSSLQ